MVLYFLGRKFEWFSSFWLFPQMQWLMHLNASTASLLKAPVLLTKDAWCEPQISRFRLLYIFSKFENRSKCFTSKPCDHFFSLVINPRQLPRWIFKGTQLQDGSISFSIFYPSLKNDLDHGHTWGIKKTPDV